MRVVNNSALTGKHLPGTCPTMPALPLSPAWIFNVDYAEAYMRFAYTLHG